LHTSLSKSSIALAIGLSGLAGYVDAIGFLELKGYFVSFMSGNSTRMVVELVSGNTPHATLVAGIIFFFVLGSMIGTFVSRLADPSRQSFNVLLLVTLLLMSAAFLNNNGHPAIAIAFMTLAMGAENAVFQRNGDVMVGLTYMTGTLVKIGQRIADAALGGDKLAWLPYVLLWLGLIMGGATGVIFFQLIDLASIWIAVFWAATLTFTIKFFPIQYS